MPNSKFLFSFAEHFLACYVDSKMGLFIDETVVWLLRREYPFTYKSVNKPLGIE